ncbi:MAG TPA: glycosyltransferase family 39 protein [Victivallales bacterium]|nr:glycosyltransferase family 39 protein [Victivallales bacterium]
MKRGSDNLFISLLCVLMFCGELFSIWDKSLTYDEGAHVHYGLNILRGDSSRFDDSKMPVTALNAIPTRFAEKMKIHLLGDKTPTILFYHGFSRIPTMIFSLFVLCVIFKWARHLYGSWSARVAGFLFAFSPNIIAHSSLATNDVYAMGGVLFSVVSFYHLMRRRSLSKLLLFSLALSFAMISKFTCVFLYPMFFAMFLLRYLPVFKKLFRGTSVLPSEVFFKALLKHFAIFAILSLLFINSAYFFNGSLRPLKSYNFRSDDFRRIAQNQFFASVPVPLPAPMIEGLDWINYNQITGKTFGNVYMLGRTAPRGEGFLLYYFVVWFFKIPLGTQMLFYLALLGWLRSRAGKFRRILFEKDFIYLLFPAIFFFVLLSVVLKAQLGVRYLLICMPFIFVFSAGWAGRNWYFSRRRALILIICLWNIISLLSYWPHFIAYFNELSLDRKNNWRILGDSNIDWGQNVKYLKEYAISNPNMYFNPEDEVEGLIVVDVNNLNGVLCSPERYRWLRDKHEPIGHIAYSYIIYDTSKSFSGIGNGMGKSK